VLNLLVTYVCLKAYWLLSMQFGRWTDAYWFEAALKCALWIPSCAIVTALLHLGTGQSAGSALGLSAGARRGLLFGVVATMPMAAAALALPRTPINPDLIAGSTLIGPFAEELLFRGFLFTLLVRRAGWHVVPAMILSSLIFGLAHLRNADVQFVSIVFGGGPSLTTYVLPYAAGGALFAWVTWRSQSLWPAIALHALMNFWWDLTTGEHGQLDFTIDPMSAAQAISAVAAIALTLRWARVPEAWRLGPIRRN